MFCRRHLNPLCAGLKRQCLFSFSPYRATWIYSWYFTVTLYLLIDLSGHSSHLFSLSSGRLSSTFNFFEVSIVWIIHESAWLPFCTCVVSLNTVMSMHIHLCQGKGFQPFTSCDSFLCLLIHCWTFRLIRSLYVTNSAGIHLAATLFMFVLSKYPLIKLLITH